MKQICRHIRLCLYVVVLWSGPQQLVLAQSTEENAAVKEHMAMLAQLQSTAMPDPTIAAGTVRVHVVDQHDQPVGGQIVSLGLMAQDGKRSALAQTTNRDGIAEFSRLSTESSASYRAKMVWQEVTFAAPPFQFSSEQGYAVRLVRLPVSSDERPVLQHGQFIMELRNERLHVIQHARISNFGNQAYRFPQEGKLVELPRGYSNLQFQEQMTDQRMVEEDGKGFRVFGSLVPGTVTLSWSYHLPVDKSTMVFDVPTNWNTYRYQVVIVDIDGLSLAVNDLEVTEFEHQGRTLLGTELRRAPQDAPLPSIRIMLSGIPGPGPLRWIALSVAVLLALGLAWLLGRAPASLKSVDVTSQKNLLIEQVTALEWQRSQHHIGPTFYEAERQRLIIDLAQLLRMESKLKNTTDKLSAR